MAKAELLMPLLLKWEGGFVNDPKDLGGATNKGVTLCTFRQFYGEDKTIEELKVITDEQWSYIFTQGYWDKCLADQIENQSMANLIVDFCYNSGTHAIEILQKLLGVSVDGVVGDITISSLNEKSNSDFFYQYRSARINFLERICKRRPANRRFMNGWRNRILSYNFKA